MPDENKTQGTIPIYFPTDPYGVGEEVIGMVTLDGDTATIKLVDGKTFESLLIGGGVYIGMAVLLSPASPKPPISLQPDTEDIPDYFADCTCNHCKKEREQYDR